MDMLLFIVMVPFFLLLGLAWIVGIVEHIKMELWCKDLERKTKEASRIEDELIAAGMPWSEAGYRARCRAFGYEER